MAKLASEFNKDNKFKPHKTPRYLPGSEDTSFIDRDLRQYNQHLYNVYSARHKIDVGPPKFHAPAYMRMISLTQDKRRLREIDRDNKDMLKKINWINRNGGKLDTWNPHTYKNFSQFRKKELEYARINEDNFKIYKRIMGVTSLYSKAYYDVFWSHVQKKMNYFMKYPHYKIETKDDELRALPSVSEGLTNDLSVRQRCFLEFRITEGYVNLGKVVIDLYFDHAPKAAQEFWTMTKEKSAITLRNCHVHKIYKDKFLVLKPVPGSSAEKLTDDSQEGDEKANDRVEDSYELKHSKTGVLSRKSNGQILITFNEQPGLDKKSIGFGKVVRGAENLLKINDYGRKFGTPVMDILITHCGQIRRPVSSHPS